MGATALSTVCTRCRTRRYSESYAVTLPQAVVLLALVAKQAELCGVTPGARPGGVTTTRLSHTTTHTAKKLNCTIHSCREVRGVQFSLFIPCALWRPIAGI